MGEGALVMGRAPSRLDHGHRVEKGKKMDGILLCVVVDVYRRRQPSVD